MPCVSCDIFGDQRAKQASTGWLSCAVCSIKKIILRMRTHTQKERVIRKFVAVMGVDKERSLLGSLFAVVSRERISAKRENGSQRP